jgi:hypothetical protein
LEAIRGFRKTVQLEMEELDADKHIFRCAAKQGLVIKAKDIQKALSCPDDTSPP